MTEHLKYYKFDEGIATQYLEIWYDETERKATVHKGKVGYQGQRTIHQILEENELQQLYVIVKQEAEDLGFVLPKEENYSTVVVQYQLKSKFGNKRDLWLKDKVQDYLDNHLGWHGLGAVNGFDLGAGKLNIFCDVIQLDKGISGIKSCLRTSRLDYTQARIAYKTFGTDVYTLAYAKNMNLSFELI
ncbi:hypothetical protein [Sphingobacterium yanglingense]|uniref:Uncharacterized protein n=1 Tax=Sphingobacterium yanglingense TaxID=1437280 RepID=A0A4R6WM88_9SPHI|nr:hypothetical protein [Sphingobacterium yanglingense]TDQ79445.1 hypothetical protein CLV99_0882 [Sphingobacterium yanglingense]